MKLKSIYEDVFYNPYDLIESYLEEDYPTTWDSEAFAMLDSFAARKRYADAHLRKLKGGTGRQVYVIDSEKVLKLAKNRKGIAQNETEIDWGGRIDFEEILAKTWDHDHEDYTWVEMELARRMTKPMFKKMHGFSFDDFGNMVKDYSQRAGIMDIHPTRWVPYTAHVDDDVEERIYEDDTYMYTTDIMDYAQLPGGDLARISSWGIVKRDGEDRAVIIDYGLTSDVYDDYYK